MTVAPTTWRTTPACATEAMIEAGAKVVRLHRPYCGMGTARLLAKGVINAALDTSPKPPLPEPPVTGDAAHG